MGPPDRRLGNHAKGKDTPLHVPGGTYKGARWLLQGVWRQPWESENITQKSLWRDERACDTLRGTESSETTCSQPGTTRDTAYHGRAPLQRTVHQRHRHRAQVPCHAVWTLNGPRAEVTRPGDTHCVCVHARASLSGDTVMEHQVRDVSHGVTRTPL